MIVTRLSASDYDVQPWKNGGGSTTQLALGRHGSGWAWRVSIAEVNASGPFSAYDNIDRIIMLVQGSGMVLSFDRAPARRIDQLHVPFAFDGGWKTDCRLLDGPVRDLNLMVDRRLGRGTMEILSMRATPASLVLTERCNLFYCLAGCVEAGTATQRTIVSKNDTLRVDEGGGRALEMHPLTDVTTLVHMSVGPR
jgi:uncharacterized protein